MLLNCWPCFISGKGGFMGNLGSLGLLGMIFCLSSYIFTLQRTSLFISYFLLVATFLERGATLALETKPAFTSGNHFKLLLPSASLLSHSP
jgi:hypothetical protein